MSQPALIGTTAPDGMYVARYLHWSAAPDQLVPVFRQIWHDTFSTDTTRMTTDLLAHDWSHLTARADGSASPPLVVPGVGVKSPGGTGRDPFRGHIVTADTGYMEWLYLIDPDADTVVVYEATRHQRWLRHSLHHLQPGDDLFTPVDAAGVLACTACGAVDETDHEETASMAGYGRDTATRCTRCGSSVTTDPIFGTHSTRSGTGRPG